MKRILLTALLLLMTSLTALAAAEDFDAYWCTGWDWESGEFTGKTYEDQLMFIDEYMVWDEDGSETVGWTCPEGSAIRVIQDIYLIPSGVIETTRDYTGPGTWHLEIPGDVFPTSEYESCNILSFTVTVSLMDADGNEADRRVLKTRERYYHPVDVQYTPGQLKVTMSHPTGTQARVTYYPFDAAAGDYDMLSGMELFNDYVPAEQPYVIPLEVPPFRGQLSLYMSSMGYYMGSDTIEVPGREVAVPKVSAWPEMNGAQSGETVNAYVFVTGGKAPYRAVLRQAVGYSREYAETVEEITVELRENEVYTWPLHIEGSVPNLLLADVTDAEGFPLSKAFEPFVMVEERENPLRISVETISAQASAGKELRFLIRLSGGKAGETYEIAQSLEQWPQISRVWRGKPIAYTGGSPIEVETVCPVKEAGLYCLALTCREMFSAPYEVRSACAAVRRPADLASVAELLGENRIREAVDMLSELCR